MSNLTLTKYHLINAYHCLREPLLDLIKPKKQSPDGTFKQVFLSNINKTKIFQRQLFAEGIDLSKGGEVSGNDLILSTKMALNSNVGNVYFDAAFKSLDGLMNCKADIFFVGTRSADMYLSKTSISIKEPNHIMECGFKYHVIKSSGYEKPVNIKIVYINKDYIFDGNYDLEKLFIIEDVTPRAKDNLVLIEKYKEKIRRLHEKREIPAKGKKKISLCTKPFPCKFYNYCWTKPLKDNEPYRKPQAITKFLDGLNLDKPHYYLHFGSIRPAIPIFIKSKPYQYICFQYCLLYKESDISDPYTKSFICESGKDPRKEFIENFLRHTSNPGYILVYKKEIVEAIFLELIDKEIGFPEYTNDIKERMSRLKFLEEPFEKPSFSDKAKKKYYSLNAILSSLHSKYKGTNNDEQHRIDLAQYEEFDSLSVIDKIKLKRRLQEDCSFKANQLVEIVKSYQEKAR